MVLDDFVSIPKAPMIRRPMLAQFLVVLVASLVGAERPSDADDKIELSFHGHFVANRPTTRAHRHGRANDLSVAQAISVSTQQHDAGVGALMELSSSPNTTPSTRSVAAKFDDPPTNVNVSLAQVEETGLHGPPGPDFTKGLTKQKRNETRAAEAQTTIRGQNFKGCKKIGETSNSCKSLCFRIWCTRVKFGACDDFDAELQSLGNYLPHSQRRKKGDFEKTLRRVKVRTTGRDEQGELDVWSEDLKLNIADGHINTYIEQLRDSVGGNGLVEASTRKKYGSAFDKVLLAFSLRQAYDEVWVVLVRGESPASALKNLDKAIADVESHPRYDAMATGVSDCKDLAAKASVIAHLVTATNNAKPLKKSTDKKVDSVLMSLYEYREKARENSEKDRDLQDEFKVPLQNADEMYDAIQANLNKYFTDQIGAARNAGPMEGSEAGKALANLIPVIQRMEKMEALFSEDDGLAAARRVLDEIQTNLRNIFADKVLNAREALGRMDKVSDLDLAKVQQGLEAGLKSAQACNSEGNDNYVPDTISNLRSKGDYVSKIDLKELCGSVVDMKKSLAQIKAWKMLQRGIEAGEKACEEQNAYDEGHPVAEPDEKSNSASAKQMSASEKSDMQAVDRARARATERLRGGIDECKCAEMPDNFNDELDRAEDLCTKLGGCGPPRPCMYYMEVRSKRSPKDSDSFGGTQTKPAAVIVLLLTMWLYSA